MSCPHPIDAGVLADYWLGALKRPEEETVEEHLLDCDECGAHLREVIEAYVVLRAGNTESAELACELQHLVKTRYAAHAYPRAVHFIDSLPKTPSGKIQRHVLRSRRRAELATAEQQ